jgi:hypothetical protein
VCSNSRSLLVLSCSQRKRPDSNLLPASERYDGPTFRVLRRFLKEQPLAPLDIFILSAKFGFIPHNRPIPNYDLRMTQLRALELQPIVIRELKRISSSQSYEKLFICAGRDYLQALDGYDKLITPDLTVKIAEGGLGQKLADLHNWLYGKPPDRHSSPPVSTPKGRAVIRGIEVSMTPAQVFDIARCALANRQGEPVNYQSWYVLVDEQRVSPKWLVSQLTGLPVSNFQAREARNVLQYLGIGVYRV